MDASAELPALPEQPEAAAELCIVNGRLGGARRALTGPLTLIGQGTGCDLRLSEDGVALLHCAIIRDKSGPVLRDLETPGGTRVNGKPVTTCRLANGDRIEIGAIQIEVALETPPTDEQPSVDLLLAQRDRESLRIQAAAVVAQQAALDEVESRLDQHRVALERQETQLASHLDGRNQKLAESEKSLEFDRAQLRGEREEMARDKAELAAQQQQFAKQRQNLQDLRRQLIERYKRMARQQEAALARREAEAHAITEKAKRERATVGAFQERVNGELELGRQQLREQRRLMEEAKATREAAAREQLETIEQQRAELKRQTAEIAEAHKALAAQQQAWETRQAALAREVEGLERRIKHTRERLDAVQSAGNTLAQGASGLTEATLAPIIPPPMAPALQPPEPPPTHELQEFSEMLGDQRMHLLSQWRQLFEVQQRWQDERQAFSTELERAAEEVTNQEQALDERRQQLQGEENALFRRQEDFAAHRASLDGWRARLTADEASWKSQQQNLLDDLASRESLWQQRQHLLEQVHHKRNTRRKQEVAELLALRARCEEARKVYLQRWQEYEHLRAEQDQESRDLAARALAIEQARDELIHAAPDSARAATQLERLRKRERARLEAEAKNLEAGHRRLAQDLARAEQDTRAARQREEELLARQLDLSQRLDAWADQEALAAEEETRRQQELRRLRARHAVDERHLRELREELERLARLLIEEGNSGPARAA